MSRVLRMPPGPWMTADAFADWPGEPGVRNHQLVDGEPVAMSPSTLPHGRLQARLARLIGNHLAAARPECEVVTEPGVQPAIDPSHNVRVPDLAVGCNLGSTRWLPDPLLIVEILSPSNARETRDAVRACLTIPSLRAVLILASEAVAAEVYLRRADGAWPPEPLLLGPGDTLRLNSLGFACPMDTLHAGFGLA